jgi:hypothetical protein
MGRPPWTEQDGAMAKVAPFHTNSIEYSPEHRRVHHDNNDCPYGSRVLAKDREAGSANKPRCSECEKLA